MSEFGDLLRRLRREANISQKALAEQVGVDPSHLNRVERGIRNPPKTRTIIAIANALLLDTEARLQLLDAAGRSQRAGEGFTLPPLGGYREALAYSSPIRPSDDLEHPTVRSVAETLADGTIPLEQRLQIAEKVRSFTEWLRESAEKGAAEEAKETPDK